MLATARQWLGKITALARSVPQGQRLRIMNVCGGHERTITMAGLRKVLPANIDLIPGPGCPVCICPEEDVYAAIQLALKHKVILLAFGDLLRVPVNVAKDQCRSLQQARSAGADIRPIASPDDAVTIAKQHADRPVVFFAAGFETTMAPVAAMLAQAVPDNLFMLLSGRRTWPAVAHLLSTEDYYFDALIAPGHVATVMGPQEWNFVTEQHHLPVAVGGFTVDTLLAALYSVLRQSIEQQCFVDNCYPDIVRSGGNPQAIKTLEQVMSTVDAPWRGLGVIPASGFALQANWQQYDARLHYPAISVELRRRAGQMPPGCDCAGVVTGRIQPDGCRLYGQACTPRSPVGPCMVSDEGACRIWWAGGLRRPKKPAMAAQL